jgi:predicted RNase H-like nuclease
MATRPPGSKWRYRLADRRSHSSSAMMLFRVPVGKMFYQGAPRLLASGVRVEPCRRNEDARVAVEAYPAVVARRFLGRTAYKRDAVPDTPERRSAREMLLAGLESRGLQKIYGFTVKIDDPWKREFVADPSADALDSLLCAVQAAWAYSRRDDNYGVPPECDTDEGWIVDPALLTE